MKIIILIFIAGFTSITCEELKEATINTTLPLTTITITKNKNTTAFLEPLFNSNRISAV